MDNLFKKLDNPSLTLYLIVAILSFTLIMCSNDGLASEVKYIKEADVLSEIGLFKGTNNGYELHREPTRLEGAVMLVRLLAKENYALERNYSHPYQDVPSWGDPYIGFMYKYGLTQGISNTHFGSNELASSRQYLTFALRALGYDDTAGDFTWFNSNTKALEIGLITEEMNDSLTSNTFLRDDVAGISYYALSNKINGEERTLWDKLVDDQLIVNSSVDKYMYFFSYKAIKEAELLDRLKQEYTLTLITTNNYDELMPVSTATSNTITWYGYELDDINLYFSESALDTYIFLLTAVESINSQVKAYLNAELTYKLDVYVTNELDDVYTMYYGGYNYRGKYVFMNSHETPINDIRMLYAHELTHAFQYDIWNEYNTCSAFCTEVVNWIYEGMAEYVARHVVTYDEMFTFTGRLHNELDIKGYSSKIQYFQEREQINLSEVDAWPKEWSHHVYYADESIVYFLISEYGNNNFLEWIQLVSDGMTLDQATKMIFGKDEKELVEEWKLFFSL